MARELGLNPKKLGRVDNPDQEPWKQPLPQFIEHLYFKRIGRERPESIVRMEKRRQLEDKKKVAGRRPRRNRCKLPKGQRMCEYHRYEFRAGSPLDERHVDELWAL